MPLAVAYKCSHLTKVANRAVAEKAADSAMKRLCSGETANTGPAALALHQLAQMHAGEGAQAVAPLQAPSLEGLAALPELAHLA